MVLCDDPEGRDGRVLGEKGSRGRDGMGEWEGGSRGRGLYIFIAGSLHCTAGTNTAL